MAEHELADMTVEVTDPGNRNLWREAGTVEDSGVGYLDVPVLAVAVPDVAGIKATITQGGSASKSGGLELSFAGWKAGVETSVTTTWSLSWSYDKGARQVLVARVPYIWTVYSDPANPSRRWTELDPEVAGDKGKLVLVDGEARPTGRDREDFGAHGADLTFTKNLTTTRGATLGLEPEVADGAVAASITVTVEGEASTEFELTLPDGHDYTVFWTTGPVGAIVELTR